MELVTALPMWSKALEMLTARPFMLETDVRPMSAAARAYSITSWPADSQPRRTNNDRRRLRGAG